MIAGKQVSIAALIPEDFQHLFRWANDVDAANLNGPYRPADWQTHMDWCTSVGRDSAKVVFAIRKLGFPNIIGYVQLVNIHSVHRSADIGIRIGEVKDRAQGYGSDALQLAVNYGWKHLNLNRIGLTVFKHNLPAIAMYKAQGFKKEGLLRRAVYVNGQAVDVVLMAKLRPVRLD